MYGFGISEYRSFGPDLQRIGPLKKINFFIGQNNSGKSNILLFLNRHWSDIKQKGWQFSFNDLDRHRGESSDKLIFEIGLKMGEENYRALLQKYKERMNPSIEELLARLLTSEALTKGTELAWFRYQAAAGLNGAMNQSAEWLQEILSAGILSKNDWGNLWHQLNPGTGGGVQEWISQTCILLSPIRLGVRVSLIPAIRKVDYGKETTEDFDGTGIVPRLAKLQNPSIGEQRDKERFNQIHRFLKTVTGNRTAELEIPHDRGTILVHMDGKTLPLNSLGTGIHEVVIIAAAATVLDNQVVCIEEPEMHMHPSLQKKLVRYLARETDNQYFISTHSAHLLDTPDAAVFHVRLEGGQSRVESALTDYQKSVICADLGYHASDLLQANSVIWVEGPSDRIYLNYWIHAVEPELVEGLHYSIMFYGGRLLSHLSADDNEVEEFISLRRLNRYISIVIDSDRTAPKKHLNATKKRVKNEFDKGPGFAWITKGREIENYVDPEVLESSVKKVHPRVTGLRAKGFYDNRLNSLEGDRIDFKPDKVKIAKEITKQRVNLDVLDLKKRIMDLVKFICHANDLKPTKQD